MTILFRRQRSALGFQFALFVLLWKLEATFALQIPESVGSSKIDYFAVNAYIKKHYGTHAYFPQNEITHSVFNARQGIISSSSTTAKLCQCEASLHTSGFQLIQAPTEVENWNDRKQLHDIYLPELQTILGQEFGTESIRHLEFYHPMLRGEDLDMTSPTQQSDLHSVTHGKIDVLPTSPVAPMAHIDNDFGAFEVDRLVGLVHNNCMGYPNKEEFPRQSIIEDIQRGHRFLVINCWRNAGSQSIQRAPLGIFATQYPHSPSSAFPGAQPDLERSRWYIYPEMNTTECLLFKQYDRDSRFMSDLWHCALPSLSSTRGASGAEPRRSLDIRAFIVLNEKTPVIFDRYRDDRLRPDLSYEESGEFCNAQEGARK